jgi:hypothetical protein
LKPGFEISSDKKKVKCTICAPLVPLVASQWISPDSIKKHLTSALDLRAQGHSADVQCQQAAIEAVNQDEEMQFADLEPMSVDERLDSQSIQHKQIRSEAEEAMWEDFDYNGATFDAGCDNSQDEDRRRLEREVREFGLWDAERAARSLGFGVAEHSPEDEEDDYLADLLASTGK